MDNILAPRRIIVLVPAALAILGLLCCLNTAAAQPVATVSDITTPQVRPEGAPKPSDVCFSTRWPRGLNPNDPHDGLAAAKQFHATRLDWLYTQGKAEFIQRAKERGYTVSAAVNSTLPDKLGSRDYTIGRARYLDGKPVIASWMRAWGMYWGCCNSPEYRKLYLDFATADVDLGADYLQTDGELGNIHLPDWGGCFCEHCVAGFREFLNNSTTGELRAEMGITDLAAFDYAGYLRDRGTESNVQWRNWKGDPRLAALFVKFQEESMVRFYTETFAAIDAHAGRHVPQSGNHAGPYRPHHRLFDYFMAETYPYREGLPRLLYHERILPSREVGKPYVFTFVTDDVSRTRRFIALSYALGAHVIVPWDVYTGSDTPRVFATPDQYADLYGFVRANADLLDGYEEAAVTGPGWTDERYDSRPPVRVDGPSEVYATVRAKPGDPAAPVAVHLVDYSEHPEPFRVILDPARFFGDRPLKLRLLTPAAYDAQTHAQAEESGDFAALAESADIPGGRATQIAIPALNPWGILVVEPGDGDPEQSWEPAIWAEHSDRFREHISVRITSPDSDATLRYTVDGSAPGPGSSEYTGPIQLTQTTTISARAYTPRGPSATVRATFTLDTSAPKPAAPDTPGLGAPLVSWLSAQSLIETHEDGDEVRVWPAEAGPDATVPALDLSTGAKAGPPVLDADGINGRAALWFRARGDLLSAPGVFADLAVPGAPTVFVVMRSEDPEFGICGNALNGSGGIPRLYMTQGRMHYDTLDRYVGVALPGDEAGLVVYRHDGLSTASVRTNGIPTASRDDIPAVAKFGGGNLAMPFCSGNRERAGMIAEVVVFGGPLPEDSIRRVEEYLLAKYGIPGALRWK
ncbi:MAG: chitobiase/beta-hexosaminidase C-terminal domain-containing protein [Acidobacteriota bacterium]|nr:chitobiase/beta-hexosaminidase C-terminal domain-containing protein [Acidobacteriota bacterium]